MFNQLLTYQLLFFSVSLCKCLFLNNWSYIYCNFLKCVHKIYYIMTYLPYLVLKIECINLYFICWYSMFVYVYVCCVYAGACACGVQRMTWFVSLRNVFYSFATGSIISSVLTTQARLAGQLVPGILRNSLVFSLPPQDATVPNIFT